MRPRVLVPLATFLAMASHLTLGSFPAYAQAPALAEAPLEVALTGAAKLDYDAAHLLYDNGDFAGALIKFKSAYSRSHDPRLLWDAAACEKNQREYAKATQLVKQYLRESGDRMSPSSRADANAFLDAAAPFVAHLAVSVNEAAANVYVDGDIVGVTPLAQPVLVSIGTRKLRVAKDGFMDYTTELAVTGSGDLAVPVVLKRDVHEGRVHVQTGSGQTIAIDQHVVGVGDWEGILPSGGHTLRVTGDNKRAYQSELAVQDNQARLVNVTLEDEPRALLPTWAWVAGGAVVAGGLAVGGYFLFKPSDTPGSPTTIGTMPTGTVIAAHQGSFR